jgi:hypothetical protein
MVATQAHTRLPRLAILLGVAGLIPFLGAGLGSVVYDQVQASRMVSALMAYGAVILAFLGGVHWGLAMDTAEAPRVARIRLILGVIPSLIGWGALLLALMFPPEGGLALLIFGFVITMLTEARAGRQGLIPTGYLWLRWGLSVVVVAALVTVLVLRMLGAHVMLPLPSTQG